MAESFKCNKCSHDQFVETYDRLYRCESCNALYIPETMTILKIGASSYIAPGIPEPLPLNELPVNVKKYTGENRAIG